MSPVADSVRSSGYGVLAGLLDPDEVDRSIEALEDVFAREDDIARRRQWLTSSYRVTYMAPAKHPVFLDLCRRGPLVDLAEEVLGPDLVFAGFNGMAMVPGGDGQTLHRDHPVLTPGVTLYLHAVVALDRFTTANGATRIVPGSHRDGSSEAGERSEVEAVSVELAPGDAVVFDATCLHAGSANTTSQHRRALHIFFCRGWIQPHWDFRASLRPDDAALLDDERRRLLGFDRRAARYDHTQRRSYGLGWG